MTQDRANEEIISVPGSCMEMLRTTEIHFEWMDHQNCGAWMKRKDRPASGTVPCRKEQGKR